MAAAPRWRRRQTLVNPEHQLRFTSVLLAQMTAVMLAIAAFAFLESRRTMDLVLRHLADFPLPSHELHLNNQAFLVKVILVVGVTAVVQILFGIYTSHKLAGPVLKMTRVLQMAASGEYSARVSFRKGDQLEGLAAALNRMLASLSAQQARARAEVESIEQALAALRARPGSVDPSEVHALQEHIARLSGAEAAPEPVGR